MKLCIIGTGAAGWMACAKFKNEHEIVIVGSPEIPSIGVGESNTMRINMFHDDVGINQNEFVTYSDAAVKYGVYYKNWSKNDFIHNFKDSTFSNNLFTTQSMFYKSLANKPKDLSINEIVSINLQKAIHSNHVFFEDAFYPKSWHFDAGKYINFLSSHCMSDENVTHLKETVIDLKRDKDGIVSIITDCNTEIHADYFIFATGYNKNISRLLDEKYVDLSDVLLTNKAFVYPLEFSDKKSEFHPYTVAKTMKCGWRWITPTYSRIGTGYVFSSEHISEDEACAEFLADIGNNKLEPKLVNFYPKYSEKTFKENYCTIGLANGFLEPLDAPGLTLTIDVLNHLQAIFLQNSYINDKNIVEQLKTFANDRMESRYEFWAAFILAQYKTCTRSDTKFWEDHKKVEYAPLDHILNIIGDININNHDYIMFMHTIAAKDQTWKTKLSAKPFKYQENELESTHHLDYINAIRTSVSSFRPNYPLV